jgi:hypothetical protein
LERGDAQQAVEYSLQAVGFVHYFPEAHFRLGMGLEKLGRPREAILAYETALGMGYRPLLLHQLLANLYRPIDPAQAAMHGQALLNAQKPRIFRADIKSTLPPTRDPDLTAPA